LRSSPARRLGSVDESLWCLLLLAPLSLSPHGGPIDLSNSSPKCRTFMDSHVISLAQTSEKHSSPKSNPNSGQSTFS
jgi:hypothetical protein